MAGKPGAGAEAAADAAARGSYARLIAFVAARTRDVAAAEDALADAFLSALQTWPQTGIPRSPEAWLLTVARRAHGAGRRRARRREVAAPAFGLALEEAAARAAEGEEMQLPDHRVKLLFGCAHPAIDAAAHASLMSRRSPGSAPRPGCW